MESEDSRSGSSSNESDNEDGRHSRSRAPSCPQSPGSETGRPDRPRSPDSAPSRSRSNSVKSNSATPENKLVNGPRSPPSPDRAGSVSPSRSNRSNSASSFERSPSRSDNGSRPLTPKSEASYASPKRGPSSPAEPPGSPKNSRPSSRYSDSDNSSIRSRKRSSSRSSSRSSRRSRRRSASYFSEAGSRDSSSARHKSNATTADTKPEDISDGDMESDQERPASPKEKPEKNELNISHEDLSDVSDLEDSIGEAHSEDEKVKETKKSPTPSDRVERSNSVNDNETKPPAPEKKQFVDTTRTDEAEEQLDFEAEDGECEDVKSKDGDKDDKEEGEEDKEEGLAATKEEKELEEGEVTDEDDARPEETEPRPVCRFFSRGACTWGASCRFLHPGVTDKGNYTMFDMVRPMLPGEYGMGRMMDDRMYKPEATLIESAWERGLRTAKEMLKKSMRRKEQDIDFEEKKMNLSIAQEEFDKENGYYGRIPSPEPRYVRHMPEFAARPPPEEYYGRRPIPYEPEYMPPRREHPRPYREMGPPVRGPPPEYYQAKFEEEPPPRVHERPEARSSERHERERRKPKREVIVQRAEKEDRPTRGDEWQDPWMRSKSPGRRKDRKRSYSSGSSSYSSSSSRSSTATSKSSYRSRSRSSYRRDRSKSKQRAGRHVSPSVIVSERKAANERAALMNPPAPKRRAPSPGMMRVSAANPPAPSKDIDRARNKLAVAAALARVKSRAKRSSRSSSGSSSGSSSDSDSSESSSSSSRSNSPPSRDVRKATELVKAMDALKSAPTEKTKIKLTLKNPQGPRKPDVSKVEPKKRPATSPPANDPKAKKATSRREELLKQLKAVEDAIAKKRSKV